MYRYKHLSVKHGAVISLSTWEGSHCLAAECDDRAVILCDSKYISVIMLRYFVFKLTGR